MNEHTELTIQQQGQLVIAINNHGIGDVLKPLTKEIHLFDTYVAGTSYIEDESVFEALKPGTALILRREQNRYDDNAIRVLDEAKQKIGYVPERDNLIFSRLMDAGKMLTARVAEIQKKGSYTQISIKIYLVDF